MCRILIDGENEVCDLGELRKWASPVPVPILRDYSNVETSDDNCLCPVDWEAMGKAMGGRFEAEDGWGDMRFAKETP